MANPHRQVQENEVTSPQQWQVRSFVRRLRLRRASLNVSTGLFIFFCPNVRVLLKTKNLAHHRNKCQASKILEGQKNYLAAERKACKLNFSVIAREARPKQSINWRGLLRRSFLTPRNDNFAYKFFVQTLFKRQFCLPRCSINFLIFSGNPVFQIRAIPF